MTWIWNKGIPTLAPTSCHPGRLELTSGYTTTLETVPRLELTVAYQTLGVYISPSGAQKKQMEVLRSHSQNYYISLSSSPLTTEDFWSYMVYLRPRLIYPLPCCSLTAAQCRYIQVPALAALLPKLRLNHHTPCSVLFYSPTYGGLSIPVFYVDKGYGQLKYTMGHLQLNDENGKLIRILLSYLQLHIGSTTPALSLPYAKYGK
jgi:hypothetical protein